MCAATAREKAAEGRRKAESTNPNKQALIGSYWTYEGDVVEGKENGCGVVTFSSTYEGQVYMGEFKNGKREGRGVYEWSSGSTYEGEWRDNKRDGRGVWRDCNGDVYEGEYKSNRKEGKGVIRYPTGSSYEGEFRNDKLHGKGVYKNACGNVLKRGEWEYGVYVG